MFLELFWGTWKHSWHWNSSLPLTNPCKVESWTQMTIYVKACRLAQAGFSSLSIFGTTASFRDIEHVAVSHNYQHHTLLTAPGNSGWNSVYTVENWVKYKELCQINVYIKWVAHLLRLSKLSDCSSTLHHYPESREAKYAWLVPPNSRLLLYLDSHELCHRYHHPSHYRNTQCSNLLALCSLRY